jgi:hypothetical protein
MENLEIIIYYDYDGLMGYDPIIENHDCSTSSEKFLEMVEDKIKMYYPEANVTFEENNTKSFKVYPEFSTEVEQVVEAVIEEVYNSFEWLVK